MHPLALRILEREGLPTAGLRSKSWDEFAAERAPRLDLVLTVCGNAAAEVCPVFPGQPTTGHWPIDDPAAVEGDEATRMSAFDRAFAEVETRVKALVAASPPLAMPRPVSQDRSPGGAMTTAAVTRDDLDGMLRTHRGEAALLAALDSASEPVRLLQVLGRYVQFNSAFGPGVANLAGEIGARQGLFQDPDEPVHVVADRAAHVASDFFYAAVDEFDDRATPWRDTHRTLAQATLKGLGRHLGFDDARMNELLQVDDQARATTARVLEGYGVGAALEERDLFRAMGFHTGSEILADREFTQIDAHLRAKHAAVVKALEPMTVEILGEKHNAYYWIRIHTGVEVEHFDAALKGANNALRFYAGETATDVLKGWVLEGFADFARVQSDFMTSLARG